MWISSSLAAKVAETARLRQWFLKSTLLLERGDRGLPPASRRSFFELCQQMDFGRRLQLIGEVIEARETLYGTAAERSFEYRLFFVSCIIEAAILAGIVWAQALLGIATLMNATPLWLGIAHQLGALLVLTVATFNAWRIRRSEERFFSFGIRSRGL